MAEKPGMQGAIAAATQAGIIKVQQTMTAGSGQPFDINQHSPDVVCFLQAQQVDPGSLKNPTAELDKYGQQVEGVVNYTGLQNGKPVNVQITDWGNNSDPGNEAWKLKYNTSTRIDDTAVSVADPQVPPFASQRGISIQPRTEIVRKGVYTDYKDIQPGRGNSSYIEDNARAGTTRFEHSTADGNILQVPPADLPAMLKDMRDRAQNCGLG